MLARDLHMTRAELVQRMSASEFAHWIAFYNMEAHDREQAQKRAQRRSAARRMSAQMSGQSIGA
jgi:hypothetical protein